MMIMSNNSRPSTRDLCITGCAQVFNYFRGAAVIERKNRVDLLKMSRVIPIINAGL